MLTGANAPALQQAQNFINTYAKVSEFLGRHDAPFIARVRRPSPVSDIARGKPGLIEMLRTEQQYRRRYAP